ncbi:Zinc_finger domain-containing protein [Hexamita inflata]|uniref:Zinc finger domain-containing protein n=1 Tax=Hexamita inflata TaxID=28002 RepID=A0AA86URR7_9EUKA|nr:Zinc finger domain-containing protein [Hexamita inflata]CAI9947833.1 Zinc finger domain-containing protein [Hexamita inflata]
MNESQTAKTEICNCWLEFDACPYGDKCTFAHGFQQLQQRMDRQKQNDLCKSYQFEGVCYYGKRCKFHHDQVATGKTEQPCYSMIHKDHMINEQSFDIKLPAKNDADQILNEEERKICIGENDLMSKECNEKQKSLEAILKTFL